MQIAIRMDDITPGMDRAKFTRFKDLLDQYSIHPLIGVVPDNRDDKLNIDAPMSNYWDYVKELRSEGWTVAMHGLNHLYTTKEAGLFPIGNKSEFAGLPFEKQNEMIREGKRILEENGIRTDIFMAPSHSFDENTLKALKENGFNKVTDGFGRAPFISRGLTFYPISVSRDKSLKDEHDGIVTFVYHANTMEERDFDKLEELLKSGRAVSYSQLISMKAHDRSVVGDKKEYLTAKAKYVAVRAKRLIG